MYGLTHDLSLGPEGVNEWVVLNDECKYEECKSQAWEDEFFIVGENQAKTEDCQECDCYSLEEGLWSNGYYAGGILLNGADEDAVQGCDTDLRDYHQHAEYHRVLFWSWHDLWSTSCLLIVGTGIVNNF